MKNKNVLLIIVVGIIGGALSYWFNPYNEMNLLGISIYIWMATSAFLSSLILTFLLNVKHSKIALLVTAGILIGVMCRIVFDVIQDSTSHNLFPFELVAAMITSLPSAFVGSYMAHLIRRLKSK